MLVLMFLCYLTETSHSAEPREELQTQLQASQLSYLLPEQNTTSHEARGAPNTPSSILPITPEPTHAHLPAEQRESHTHKHTAIGGVPSACCPQAERSPRQLQIMCAAPTSSKVPFLSSIHSPNVIQTSPSSSSPSPTDSGGGSRLSS